MERMNELNFFQALAIITRALHVPGFISGRMLHECVCCEFLDLHCSIIEDSILLECDFASLRKWFRTFQRNVSPLSSGVRQSVKNDLMDYRTTRSDDASHFGTPESSMCFQALFAKLRKSGYQLCHVCLFGCLSAWNNWALTGRIFVKFHISRFFENVSRKFKFH